MLVDMSLTSHVSFLRRSGPQMLVYASVSFFCLHLASCRTTHPKDRTGLFSPEVSQRLDSQLENLLKENNLPSVEVEIQVPGRGEYSFVRGMANLTAGELRRRDQPFRIASITKPFAATAILVLVDRGQLRKTDTISKWYPNFPNADTITIDDLLRMRSGIPAPNDDEVLARVYDAPLANAPSFDEEMASYAKLKSQFKPPDSIGVYTDFNYDILAAIAEKITGKNIGTLITENVITPLKLAHTVYPTEDNVPGGLHGYGWNSSANKFDDKTLFGPPLAGAAGAVISNAEDLHAFSRALCHGKLLTPATFKAQLEGKPLVGTSASYGEGIATGSGVCGHSGTINGYSSDMYYFEKLNATLVVNVNRLDRDNKSQSTAVLGIVSNVMTSHL
jgi:D-alanyl-D-alanine carboxypeptidase